MSIDIKWDTQQRDALICEFSGDWTWHECREAMQVMLFMQEGSSVAVHHVYDLTQSTLTTRACLNRLQKLLKLEINPAPESTIIVDKAFRLHMLEDMLRNLILADAPVYFVENLESAREKIAA